MKKSNNNKVNELLNDIEMIDPEQYELLIKLRDIVFQHHPLTKERVMYGGIMFSLSDDYGGLFVRKKHISFEFTIGNTFEDPGNILEGKGKYRRHIKLRSQEDIKDKNVLYFLKQIK